MIIFSSLSNIFTSVGGVNWGTTRALCVSLRRELEENEAFDTSESSKVIGSLSWNTFFFFLKLPFFSSTCSVTSPHLSRLGDALRRRWRCVCVHVFCVVARCGAGALQLLFPVTIRPVFHKPEHDLLMHVFKKFMNWSGPEWRWSCSNHSSLVFFFFVFSFPLSAQGGESCETEICRGFKIKKKTTKTGANLSYTVTDSIYWKKKKRKKKKDCTLEEDPWKRLDETFLSSPQLAKERTVL